MKYFVEYEGNSAGNMIDPEEVDADRVYESGNEGRWLVFECGGTVALRVRQDKIKAVRSAEQQLAKPN